MDERLESIFDSIENNRLNADSPFIFHCTMCGDCCRNREDILLNPQDLFQLAKGLQIRPQDVVEKYCEYYIGSQSRMPIVRLKSLGTDKHCVFLENNQCSVQSFKPTVCAMFPLGRFYSLKTDENNADEGEFGYMLMDAPCGDKREIHTVREWLGKYNIPIDDEFYKRWVEVIGKLSVKLAEIEKKVSEAAMNNKWLAVFLALYLHYDIKKEFLPQFIQNAELIVNLIMSEH